MEKKTVIINVQTEDGVKQLDRLTAKFDEVYGEVLPLTGAIGELEDQLYQMAKQGLQNTEEFKVLAAEAGKFKKVIQQVDMQVDALSMTSANKLGGALQGATAGFEIVQGAMGAMGAESEKVQEALLKVQSAMAIAQGVQGFKEAIPVFKALGNAGKAAFNGIKGAIAATGVGLLIVALGVVASNWDKIKAGADKAAKATTNYLNSNTKSAKAVKWYLDALVLPITLVIGLFKKVKDAILGTSDATRAVAAEQQKAHNARMKQIDEEREAMKKSLGDMDRKIALLEAEGKSTIELRKKKLALQKADAESTLAALEATRAMMGKNSVLAKSYDELINNAKNLVNETKVQEALITKEEKTAQQERTANYKQQQQDKTDAKREAWEKQKAIDQEEVDALKMSRENNYKSEIDILYEQTQEEARIKKEARDKQVQEEKDANHQKLLAAQALEAAKLEIASQGLSTLNDLVGAFAGKNEKQQKRAFEIQKAVSIAQAVIDTYKGANAIFANAAANPATVLFPAQPFIQAGLAVAAGIANVKKIASTQFGGGASSGSGGGGGGSVGGAPSLSPSTPANFNIVGNSGTNQLMEGLSNQPLKAYVVSGDVTTAQSMDRNKVKTATL